MGNKQNSVRRAKKRSYKNNYKNMMEIVKAYKKKVAEETQNSECAEMTQDAVETHNENVEVALAKVEVPHESAKVEVPHDSEMHDVTYEPTQAAEEPQASSDETLKAIEDLTAAMTEAPQTVDGPAVTLCDPSNSLLIEVEPLSSSEKRFKELRNQLKTCVVPTCLKDQFSDPDLTFFSLPNDTRYRKDWCNRIDRRDLWLLPLTQVSKYHVCNLHFEERYINNFGSKLVLLSTAFPTLNLPLKIKGFSSYQKSKKTNKGVKCAVTTCENYTSSNLKFFVVPKMKKKAVVWYHNMGLKWTAHRSRYTKPNITLMICETHFAKRDIRRNRKGYQVLFENAVPTLNLPVPRDQTKYYKPPARKRTKCTIGTQTYDVYRPTNDTLLETEFVSLNNQQPFFTTSNEEPCQSIEPEKVYCEPPAKIQKTLLSKEFPQEETIEIKVENDDDDDDQNFTVVISTNPLDPKIIDSLHDSAAEAPIQDEPVELNSCENTVAMIDDSITLSNTFIRNKIKQLYENGNKDTQLLLQLCDQYCSKRTNGELQLKTEIFS